MHRIAGIAMTSFENKITENYDGERHPLKTIETARRIGETTKWGHTKEWGQACFRAILWQYL